MLKSNSIPLKIALLPGDGIGPEVMAAASPVFASLDLPFELRTGEIGWQAWCKFGNPIPAATWRLIESSDCVLLGAITSKPPRQAEAELLPVLQNRGLKYTSPIIQLRQKLDLFANVRPASGTSPNGGPFRFVVIRENTEGLYAGLDFVVNNDNVRGSLNSLREQKGLSAIVGDAAYSIRLLTRSGLTRLFEFAFQQARGAGYTKLTYADKPNVLRESGEFAIEILKEVAKNFPEISWDVQNADAVALGIVRRPEQFGVIVAENMFGDLLSDVAAAVMGGLGLAPSANIGNRKPYFEPVHGSAPKYAGRNCANPMAMFLSIGLLLEHFGYSFEAKCIAEAVRTTILDGQTLTFDLKGQASTTAVAKAVLEKVTAFQTQANVKTKNFSMEKKNV